MTDGPAAGAPTAGLPESAGEHMRRNAFETIGFRGVALALSFPATIITSRYLLPAGRGAFVLGLLTVTIAATLVGNVGAAVGHELRRGVWHTRAILAQAFTISIGLGVIAAALLIPLDIATNPGYWPVALAPIALPFMVVGQIASSTLLTLGKVRIWNYVQLIFPAAVLVGLFVLVVELHKGVTGAVTAWVVAQIVLAVLALRVSAGFWRPFRLRGLSVEVGRPMLMLGLRVGIVNVVSLLNYRTELFVLQAFKGLDAVGIYSVAMSLAELLWILSGSFATAVVSQAVASDDEQAAAAIARSVRAAIISTVLAGVVLAAVAPFAIPILFGSRFSSATVPLLILIPGVIAFAPGQVLGVYFSIRLGRTRIPLWIALFSAAITAVFAVILVPPLGLPGAALSTTAGYTVSMATEAYLFARTSGIRFRSLLPRPADVFRYGNQTLAHFRR